MYIFHFCIHINTHQEQDPTCMVLWHVEEKVMEKIRFIFLLFSTYLYIFVQDYYGIKVNQVEYMYLKSQSEIVFRNGMTKNSSALYLCLIWWIFKGYKRAGLIVWLLRSLKQLSVTQFGWFPTVPLMPPCTFRTRWSINFHFLK